MKIQTRVDEQCSEAFDAGNYASAYVSEDLDTAKSKEFPGIYPSACFVLGFFSSYEDHEVPGRYFEEYAAAKHVAGDYCKAQGWID